MPDATRPLVLVAHAEPWGRRLACALACAGFEPFCLPRPDHALRFACGRCAALRAAVVDCHLAPGGGARLLRQLLVLNGELGLVATSTDAFDGTTLRLLSTRGGLPLRLPAPPSTVADYVRRALRGSGSPVVHRFGSTPRLEAREHAAVRAASRNRGRGRSPRYSDPAAGRFVTSDR